MPIEDALTWHSQLGLSCDCIPSLSEGYEESVLFTEGDVLYGAMLASIDGARDQVWLKTFIFTDSPRMRLGGDLPMLWR